MLSQDIDALTLHARTRKEMSDVPARWEHVREVVEIRNKMGLKTKIIGNGDVVVLLFVPTPSVTTALGENLGHP